LLRPIFWFFFLKPGDTWSREERGGRHAFFSTTLKKDPRYTGPPTGYVPPMFHGEGAKESLAKFTKQNKTRPPIGLLNRAIQRVTDEMAPIWQELDPTPLTMDDAIFGSEEVETIPANTSPGWPWTNWFKSKGEVVNDPDALKAIEEDWEDLNTPDYVPTGWSMNLKDELRPLAKAHKPRAFMGGPIEMVLHGKRLFGRQDAAITGQPMATPVRVGFTPFHGGMRALWERHIARRYHWDGDYHNWDGSIPPWLLEAAMRVRMHYLQREQWQRVWNYYRSVSFAAMADPYGALLDKFGGMPSGTYTTATDNSLMNLIVLRMYEEYTNSNDFIISVYGDDNLVSTDKELDLSGLREFMLNLGLDYTSAEKDGDPYFKPLTECTFLKMHFSPDESRYPWREWERVYAILEWQKQESADVYYSRINSTLLLSWGTTAYLHVRRLADELASRDLRAQAMLLTEERVREVVLGDWLGSLPTPIITYEGENPF
jgi:hypothetical protein